MKDDEIKRKSSIKREDDTIFFPKEVELEDDFLEEVSESLKQQIGKDFVKTTENDLSEEHIDQMAKSEKKKHTALKITGIVSLCILLSLALVLGTKAGRRLLIYNLAGNYLYGRVTNDKSEEKPNEDQNNSAIDNDKEEVDDGLRHEEYVMNFLVAGIEQIGGGGRTDAVMIASINTKDDTIKLTSLLRDTYVQIPGYNNNKLNAAYAKGGIDLLIDTVELNYKIRIDGYATVDFASFEEIIDMLDGVEIELGAKEASYLRTTNYISNPSYRNVHEGVNLLNGNQALGYVRVRKVETLGGANSDFGRTVRQRRVLHAIFDKYKTKNMFDLITIMNDCLAFVTTNLTPTQMTDALEAIVENKITTMDSFRVPTDNLYTPERYDVGAVLVPDWEANLEKMYQFIFLDEVQEEVTTEQNSSIENSVNK